MSGQSTSLSKPAATARWTPLSWLLVIATLAVIGWAYERTLLHLAGRWNLEAEYSHGYFVPLFALVLLWIRRDQVAGLPWRGSWWGLILLAIGLGMRFIAAYDFYTLVGALALLPTLAGVAMLAGGMRALRWALPSIVFLVFMIPLPGMVSDLLAQPLQRVATTSSTYLLQIVGIPATVEGNVIVLTDGKIGVVEACSGLRMLVLFIAVSTAVAFLVHRRLWERVLLVASAVPIALAVNIIRITVTAIVHETISPQAADAVFHQAGGLLMGPAALAILWLEILFLDRAFLVPTEGPLMLDTPPPRSNRS